MRISQTRSLSGTKPRQRATLKAIGLGRIGQSVERDDTPQLRGQLRVVSHLVSVEQGER